MPTHPAPDPILDLDACALAAATRRGDLTCAEVAQVYLSRIAACNPALRAVMTVNAQATAQAQALDDLPAAQRGVLHGVPLLIKDNIDVAGLPTTAGSWLMREHLPAEDAPLVARLKAAGAVILGKANMTEWANFMTVGMPNGYSSLGGQTVNPWGDGLDTGGSSSGSGVAVAARLCAAAIGTETSGSIVSPAQQNGVIGLKPTLGLVPRTGIIPISHSQDTAGPITRTVRDALLLMSVMSGPDSRDEASRQLPVPSFASREQALSGARIGIVRDEPRADASTLDEAVAALQRAGASVQDVALPGRAELEGHGQMFEVLVYEFKPDLSAYLSGVQHGPRTLREVIDANEAEAGRCLRYGQTLLYAAQGTRGDLSEAGYAAARARDLRLSRAESLDQLFAAGHDALMFPELSAYALAARAGYPSLTLPVPFTRQPQGVMLVGPQGADAHLLNLAAALNRELGGVRFAPGW